MGPLTEKLDEIRDIVSRIDPESWVKIAIAGVVSLFLLALLTSPWWYDIVGQHERAAMKSLQGIHGLEVRYYAEHADKGFSCALEPLRAYASGDDDWAEALGGTAKGYAFSVVACKPESNGEVKRYGLVAVPVKPGDSGVRAFCTDQTGQLYMDVEGSGEECLRGRVAVPKK
jgi:hypothetical protein